MSNLPPLQLYQFSGQHGKSRMLLPLIALPLCLLLSAGYAYLDVYLPIGGVLTVFMVIGYVLGLGFTVALLGKVSKSRNPTALKLMGASLGAISLYAAWVFFLHALFGRTDPEAPSVLDFASNPQLMWAAIETVNETGWYTIKEMTPTGLVLWAFWAIEALAVVGGAWYLADSSIANEMFCEACDCWCPAGDMTYHEPTAQLLTAKTATITPLQLLALPALAGKTVPAFRAELVQCPSCKRAGVRYSRLRHEKNDKGELEEKMDAIPGILLPPGQSSA